MTKRRVVPANLSSVLTVGLDIGYGVTKAVTPDRVVKFPSVLGHAREIKFQQEDIAERHPGDHLKDDDGVWFVGDWLWRSFRRAKFFARVAPPTKRRWAMPARLRLAKVAIASWSPACGPRCSAHPHRDRPAGHRPYARRRQLEGSLLWSACHPDGYRRTGRQRL
ncbi:MAG: hypothetical protein IPK19_37820 [Chloroflexi bacterium]|nr:hypothetical protein [Chloroflexota bacterium]